MPINSSVNLTTGLAFGLLLVGPPKSFKTTMALQFPKVGLIDIDTNLDGPVRRLRKLGTLKPFKYVSICQEEPDVTKRWDLLVKYSKEMLMDPELETFVVDGLSTLSDCLVEHIVKTKPAGRVEFMSISDWIPYRNMLTKYINMCRSTKKLFVMTAHEEYNKDEKLGTIKTTVNIPSKLAYNLGGFFSDVWRSEVEVVGDSAQHTVRCLSTPSQDLGNSLGLPAKWKFDWTELKSKIETQ